MSNKYPRGKLCDEDEGGVSVRIIAFTPDNLVLVEFEHTLKWFAMSRAEALALAECIKSRALELQDEPQVNTITPVDVQ